VSVIKRKIIMMMMTLGRGRGGDDQRAASQSTSTPMTASPAMVFGVTYITCCGREPGGYNSELYCAIYE